MPLGKSLKHYREMKIKNNSTSYKISNILKGDKAIWGILFVMSIISIIWVYSASGKLGLQKTEFHLFKQTVIIIIGWVTAILTHKLSKSHIRKTAVLAYLIIIPLLILNLFINSRWFKIPIINVTIQFSEIAKITTIIFTAMLLTSFQKTIKEKNTFIKILIPTLLTLVLVVPLSGSAAVLIFTSNVLLIYMGRARIKHLLALAGIIILSLFLFVLIVRAFPVLKENYSIINRWEGRFTSFLLDKEKKEKDELAGSYQISQSKMAIAEGKLFGKGIGKSTCRYFLPEAYNDFIFAIIVEEAGSLFGLFVLLLYLVLLYRGIHIFLKTKDTFSRFVVLGLSVSITMQAMLNICVVVGLIPVTGQTLPLISQGGTSIVVTFFSFGIIQAITSHIDSEKQMQIAKNEK